MAGSGRLRADSSPGFKRTNTTGHLPDLRDIEAQGNEKDSKHLTRAVSEPVSSNQNDDDSDGGGDDDDEDDDEDDEDDDDNEVEESAMPPPPPILLTRGQSWREIEEEEPWWIAQRGKQEEPGLADILEEDASDTVQEQDQREKQNPEAATSPWNVQLTTRRTTSHGSEPQAEEPEWKRKKRTLTRTKPNVRRGSKMPAWAKPSVPTSSPERQGSGEMASKGSLRSSIGVAIQPASQTIGVGRNLAAGTEVV